MRLLVLVLVVHVVLAQGTDRIIGGETVSIEKYPYGIYINIRLSSDATSGSFCGGSILDAQHVLTAAHCLDDQVGNSGVQVEVVAGSTVSNGGSSTTQRRSFQKFIIHPNYNHGNTESGAHDLAIITLAQPLTLNGVSVSSIPLAHPVNDAALFAMGATFTVSGWGLTDSSSSDISNTLQAVQIQRKSCSSVPVSDLCADGPGKDSCSGDSGGPLVAYKANSGNPNVPYVLVGAVSRGPSRCDGNGLYCQTGYQAHYDWIRANSNAQPSGPAPPAYVLTLTVADDINALPATFSSDFSKQIADAVNAVGPPTITPQTVVVLSTAAGSVKVKFNFVNLTVANESAVIANLRTAISDCSLTALINGSTVTPVPTGAIVCRAALVVTSVTPSPSPSSVEPVPPDAPAPEKTTNRAVAIAVAVSVAVAVALIVPLICCCIIVICCICRKRRRGKRQQPAALGVMDPHHSPVAEDPFLSHPPPLARAGPPIVPLPPPPEYHAVSPAFGVDPYGAPPQPLGDDFRPPPVLQRGATPGDYIVNHSYPGEDPPLSNYSRKSGKSSCGPRL